MLGVIDTIHQSEGKLHGGPRTDTTWLKLARFRNEGHSRYAILPPKNRDWTGMEILKQRAIRGGFAKLVGQGATFALRLVYMIVVARLLTPAEFGLVAMVTAVTGVYDLFRDGGLSAAAVQKANVTHEQQSTLFWINMLIGGILTLLCLLTAPLLVHFYDEPRLFWVTIALSVGFIFSAAGAQYTAILQRELRYVALTVIDVIGVFISTVVAIAMAAAGYGYWSLVVSAVVLAAANAFMMWLIVPWKPGLPRREAGVASMLRFGGTVTLNGLVVYLAYNLDKILLGRFWGADALGLYSRACQLINIPTSQLNAAIGGVAFATLSRLQDERTRYKNYFLKGYSLVIALTAPITLFSAAFAEDIILVVLGPKWGEATMIFRLLTPTVLFFGIINPLAWLLMSSGLQRRSLHIALVLAPLCIASYVVGLPYGPTGVALAYSVTLALWLIPHMIWCLKGTGISPVELFQSIWPSLVSAAVAVAVAYSAQMIFSNHLESAIARLALDTGVMAVIYSVMLLLVMGQRRFYLDLVSQLRT
jgi:O-antigen/teichoic acid export membrane protein